MRLCYSGMMIFADSQWVFHQIVVLLLSMTDSEYNQELSENVKALQSAKIELAARTSNQII